MKHILKLKKYDVALALTFYFLLAAFIAAILIYPAFMNWVFDRHQNQISWYIRPLFIIPFCYAAYQRSLSGIALSLFCGFTSMCWFGVPKLPGHDVASFLEFEKNWLTGQWGGTKILWSLCVPVSFILLGIAFWRRNMASGLLVVVMIALGKIFWSIYNGGAAGRSVIIPAMTGLLICIIVILFIVGSLRKGNHSN